MNKLIALCTLLIVCASCSEDEPLTTLSTVSFPAELQATPDNVAINADNKYLTVMTVSWPEVEFPVDAPVRYALEFDVASDTIGSAAWENAIRVEAGEDVLSKSFLGSELNAMAISLGLPLDIPGEIVVRAEATLDRAVYSKAIKITVTPFVEIITQTVLYAPGSYQGWTPATAAQLNAIEAGVFQGFVTFPAGQQEFKITPEPDWDESYGVDASGNFVEEGGNISVPTPGTYQITVNLNTMTYTAVPYSYGVIGTATAGGWDNDTNMSYDHVAQQWTFTGPLVPGAIKFRLNDQWTVNYGSANGESGEIDNGVVLLDNQGAHTIIEGGNYLVTFSVNPDPATANYTITLLD